MGSRNLEQFKPPILEIFQRHLLNIIASNRLEP